jgi:phenylpropionate dioxygenase-like ring-hydroxylating dioxygenase large terminal subunit
MSAIPEFKAVEFDFGHGLISPDAEMLRSRHVQSSVYTSDERFVAEAELLGKIWLNVADMADVENPGDWIVKDISCRSASVLIARGRDGEIRAFHNVCTHRGTKLVWGESGNNLRFSCPYHAWTFDADGSLKAIPDAGCFPSLDREESGLRPVALGTWEGFIFINLDPRPRQTLEEYLAPITRRFHNLPFGKFPQSVKITQTLDSNWKLALEAQCESYHIHALHARTVSGMVATNGNPFSHPVYWEALGPHRTWSTAINPNFELPNSRPVQRYAFTHSGQIISAAEADSSSARTKGFNGTEPIDRGDPSVWGSDNMVIYPHIQLNAGANGCWLHRFLPISADQTAWEVVYYYPTPMTHKEVFAQEYALAFNRDTLIEDNAVIERQHSGLKSAVLPFIQFGEQEMMCVHSAAVTSAALEREATSRVVAE